MADGEERELTKDEKLSILAKQVGALQVDSEEQQLLVCGLRRQLNASDSLVAELSSIMSIVVMLLVNEIPGETVAEVKKILTEASRKAKEEAKANEAGDSDGALLTESTDDKA